MRHRVNFVQIGQTVAEIRPCTIFQDGGRPPSWIFQKFVILTAGTLRGPKCVTVQNFVQIGQGVAEIWPFSISQDGGRPPSWIFKKWKKF